MLRSRLVTIIWTFAGLFMFAVVGLALLQTADMKRGAIDKVAAAGQQLIAGAEVNVNRSMLGVDVLLASIPLQLEHAVLNGGQIDEARADKLLAIAAGRSLFIRGLILVRDDGHVLATSRTRLRNGQEPLPDEFLAQVWRRPAGTMRISSPWLDPSSSEHVVLLARTVQLPGGPAMALAVVPVYQLSMVMAPADVADGLTMTLEQNDAVLLATAPATAGIPGQRLATGSLPGPALTGHMNMGLARLTGEEALVTARPVLYGGLRLTVSAPMNPLLASWRQDTLLIVLVTLAFMTLAVAAASVIHWQFDRQLKTAAEVERAKATLDRALDAMADAFLLCDAKDRIVAWNGRYLQLYPWLSGVLKVGALFEDLLRPGAERALPAGADEDQLEAWRQNRLQRHLNGDNDFEQELASGEVLHIIERRTPDGGIVSVYRDITRAERELRRAKAQAEAANDAKSRFLAAMSHEIRTPLNGVLGVNSLLAQSPLNAEQQQFVKTIEASGRTLLALINDILDVSRIEAGRMELENISFLLQPLVDEVVATLRPKADEKHLTLQVHGLNDELPPLQGDPNRLRQVLFNLLGNALKFTPVGRVDLHVQLQTADAGRWQLRLRVQDTGIGIPGEVLHRLFDRFVQADGSTARNFGGSGLGLAISRDIVELMGGQIDVESQPGVGSTFTVQLTLDEGSRISARVDEPLSTAPRELCVLVAEDNEVNQLVVGTMLKNLGHRFEFANDGSQALAMASRGGWDCILMDIQMPGMDGVLATRMIRALGGDEGAVPIVALTANAMLDEQRGYREAGMVDHLAKPLSADKLSAVLQRAVARELAEA